MVRKNTKANGIVRWVAVLSLVCTIGCAGRAAATQTSNSTHYSVTETQFGGGSVQKQCGTQYCAKSSAGDTTVGSASSDNYSAQFGSNTTSEPLLEVVVTGGSQDMGVLDDTHTGTATEGIKVRNYLSNGYALYIAGAAPSQGSHQLNTPGTPTASAQGTEQFGINLADNGNPDIGANLLQVPSGSTSFGQVVSSNDTLAGTNPNSDGAYFNISDLFMYKDGDVVAYSTRSSGETDYTMSMILNVSSVTPGGKYTGVYSAIAVAVF
ncbi:MAG TPA: hypothetical protein VGM08_01075 [Candidatus Saccharimonadales bacterium]|jgi:hypothetical protein